MRPPNYFMNIVLLMTVALLAGLIYLKRDSLDFLFQKSTWGVIVISFILVMMSGQMWNQIRGASFAHRDPRTGAMVSLLELVCVYLVLVSLCWCTVSLRSATLWLV